MNGRLRRFALFALAVSSIAPVGHAADADGAFARRRPFS